MTDIEIIKRLQEDFNLEEISKEKINDYNKGYYLEDGCVIKINLINLNIDKIPNYLTELKSLTNLNLAGNQISEIEALKKIKKLKKIDLLGNEISEISALKNLKSLKKINLAGNSISNISALKDLKNLTFLNLNNNPINDISALKDLTSLTNLNLAGNPISDISALKDLKNLTELTLRNVKINDISALKDLKNLTFLNLNNNPINDISALKDLKNLTELTLRNNQISEIEALKNLKNLTKLKLSHNEISGIEVLKDLKSLTNLDLSENQISKIEALKDLKSLTNLYLKNNQISKIEALKNLKKLTILDLSENQISEIEVLKDLKSLTYLYLYENQISKIEALKNLKKLTILDLSDNQISEIETLKKLKNFTELYLSKNQISKIEALKDLKSLITLDLSGNKIKNFPKWLIERDMDITFNEYLFLGFSVRNNPIENIPIEIIEEGNGAIKDYLDSLGEYAKPINEIKVIFLGDGAVGKTSLMKYLIGKEFDRNELQTHGINIEELECNNGVKMKIWDFGGQDIMHHTHQFFLTQKSVYIVVLNAREDNNAEKWLEMIKVFGGDSPVILVTNKIDENPSAHENIKELNKKFENLKERYVRVSCETKEGLDYFKKVLNDTIEELLHVRTLWSKNWLDVKTELEEMRTMDCLKDFIHYDIYEGICEQKSVLKSHRKTLIKWLNRLGVITYFSDPKLNDTHVINPSWLTEAFYAIINSKKVANNYGKFNLEELTEILNNDKYPCQKHNFLLELMTQFELCYKINRDNYLIPDLLNKQEPEFDFKEDKSLKFKLKYKKLLPKSIFPRFMVRRHKEIKDDKKWRTGMLIKDDYFESEALIRVDESEKEISIFVIGIEKRGYLAGIISNFEDINIMYKGLEYDKLVPCICEECKEQRNPYYFTYETLKEARKKGKKSWPCETSYQDVSIRELLGILITPEDLEKEISKLVGSGAFLTKKYLEERNVKGFIETIKTLFSSIAYLLFDKEDEKDYHKPLMLLLKAIFGSKANMELMQAKGRPDCVINIEKYIYILELKLDGSAEEALKQIHDKKYYEPFRLEGKKIILIGINFSSTERNVENWKEEELKF